MKKTKTEPKKPIHKIQLGRVHYLYQVGISWIAIETDPETDWAEMPDYMRVCFGIETPKPSGGSYAFPSQADTEKAVLAAIKKKTHEQRKTYAGTVGRDSRMGRRGDKSSAAAKSNRMPDAKRKRGKPVAPMLPFESDSFTDDRKTAV